MYPAKTEHVYNIFYYILHAINQKYNVLCYDHHCRVFKNVIYVLYVLSSFLTLSHILSQKTSNKSLCAVFTERHRSSFSWRSNKSVAPKFQLRI